MSDNSSSRKIGKGMIIAAWVMVLGLLTLYFGGVLERQHNPNKTVHSRVGDEGQNEVVLKRNKFGHYVTTGQVNGVPVEFLVDTGASDVAIQ